jgi:hypothetical protein
MIRHILLLVAMPLSLAIFSVGCQQSGNGTTQPSASPAGYSMSPTTQPASNDAGPSNGLRPGIDTD